MWNTQYTWKPVKIVGIWPKNCLFLENSRQGKKYGTEVFMPSVPYLWCFRGGSLIVTYLWLFDGMPFPIYIPCNFLFKNISPIGRIKSDYELSAYGCETADGNTAARYRLCTVYFVQHPQSATIYSKIVWFCIVTVFNCQNTTGHSDYMPCTAAVFQHITVEIKGDGAVDH